MGRGRVTLGLSAFLHESSACLVVDGEPVALIEEERLNRERHTSAFPEMAVAAVLEIAGIDASEIDQISFFWQPWREIRENLGLVLAHFPTSMNLLRFPSGGSEWGFFSRIRRQAGIRGELRRRFPALRRDVPVAFIEHHLAHAASAFYPSPFEEAAILTIDGRGEGSTALWARGRGTTIDSLRAQRVPHSLGHLYAAVTDYLGLKPFFDEGTVMGLSSYGGSALELEFERLLFLRADGTFRLDLDYFDFHTHGAGRWVSRRFLERFGPRRRPDEVFGQRHMDIARALQRAVEKAALHSVRGLRQETGLANLCLAGGVTLNCVLNEAIRNSGLFANVFFQPIAHDAGAALGSALYHSHHVLGQARRLGSARVYLGGEFSRGEIEEALSRRGLRWRRSADAPRDAARLIAEGKIVGWFQGRMEAGPRALGNRSILADPRRPEIKGILNSRIKRREWFRPFAPAVTAEAADEYFILGPEGSPHMMLAAKVREGKRSLIPGATHTDGTARVQTVSREENPRFWSLLTELGRVTGIPVAINTSFNENEPIVATPGHALDCFERAGMDALVIGDALVSRE